MTNIEKIATAAVQIGNLVVAAPHHTKAIMKFMAKPGLSFEDKLNLASGAEAGFLTTLERFVRPEEAYRIANEQGQVMEPFYDIKTAQEFLNQHPPCLDSGWIENFYASIDPITILDLYEESKTCTGKQKETIMSRIEVLHHLWSKIVSHAGL